MRTFLIAFAAAGLVAHPLLAGEEKRELSSHEHGHVELRIAVEGSTLAIELEAPGENIVGFEHEAGTDEQKAAVDAAKARLADAAAIFTLPAEAGCTVRSSEAELHQEGEHNAFEAAYTFECADTAALTTIATGLFALFPSIEEIDVDYATAGGQGSVEIEAARPVVSLPSTS